MAFSIVLTGCGGTESTDDIVDDTCTDEKCDSAKTSAATPTPFPSKFDIPSDRWTSVKSYWDKTFGGEINGTFFVAVEKGVAYVQLPLYFKGSNRCTSEYYDKVVRPIEDALASAGEPIETLLDKTDHQPVKEEFTAEFVEAYVSEISAGFASLFEKADINLEVIVNFEDVVLTAFEKSLLSGGSLPTNIETVKTKISSDLLKEGKSSSYRRKDFLTFLLTPFANINQPYAQTEAYNPSLGQPAESVFHELGHYTFMYRYEGYYDPYSPPGALMGDTGSQDRAAALGIPTFLSLSERIAVVDRVAKAVKDQKRDASALDAQLATLKERKATWEARAQVGYLAEGGIKIAKSDEVLPLSATEWATLFAKADTSAPVLVVFDDEGKVVVVNGKHNDYKQYVKFMGNEVGLTYTYMENLINEKLGGS